MNDGILQDDAFKIRLDAFADGMEASERAGALQSEDLCRETARALLAALLGRNCEDCEAEYRRLLAETPSRVMHSLLQNGLNLLLSGTQGDKARLFIALSGARDAAASAPAVQPLATAGDLPERPRDDDWTPTVQRVPLLSGYAVYIHLPEGERGAYIAVGTDEKRFAERAECQSGLCLAPPVNDTLTLTREDGTQTKVFSLEDCMEGLRVRAYLALGIVRVPVALVPAKLRVGRALSLCLHGVDRLPPLCIEAGTGYLGPWKTLLTTQARTLGTRPLKLSIGVCPPACRCLRILSVASNSATSVRMIKF